MVQAFLQNNQGQYYIATIFEGVKLIDKKTPLTEAPQEMKSYEELNFESRTHFNSPQTGFIFTGDGLQIINHIFFLQGHSAKCTLTLEGEKEFYGALDFITCHVKIGHHAKICCIHLLKEA